MTKKGWYKESQRHRLASKGIKTKTSKRTRSSYIPKEKRPDLRRIDKKVRPVVNKLYDKGYITLNSCEGHPRSEKFRVNDKLLTSEPYIVVQNTPETNLVFRKAGFSVHPWKNNKKFIIATGKLEDKNKLWKNVLVELNGCKEYDKYMEKQER